MTKCSDLERRGVRTTMCVAFNLTSVTTPTTSVGYLLVSYRYLSFFDCFLSGMVWWYVNVVYCSHFDSSGGSHVEATAAPGVQLSRRRIRESTRPSRGTTRALLVSTCSHSSQPRLSEHLAGMVKVVRAQWSRHERTCEVKERSAEARTPHVRLCGRPS